MVSKRLALIIATSQYIDPTLKQLNAPAQDAKALSEVLCNKDIGNFEVKILLDEPSYKIKQDVQTWYYKGLALSKLANYKQAIISYENALKINPNFDDASRERELAADNLRKLDDQKRRSSLRFFR